MRRSTTRATVDDMRVDLLTREYPPDIYGGAGVHVTELVRALRRSIEVQVRCFGGPRDEADTTGYRVPAELAGANAALGTLGVDALVHRGGLCTTQWSRLVCFGGLGTGEVTDAGGVKLVGLSQRRSREGARFQCAALAGWDPARVVGLLALEPGERERAASALSGAARGVPVDLGDLRAAVVEQLSLR
jgi:hypothetical protein